MPSAPFRRRGLVAILAVALVATGGLAYAAIPDGGGVIHSCYTKSSGAWRVIDTDAGQSCKANEAAIDLYSKGGADALFLDQAEGDTRYLGKSAKAADSDLLDGQDSSGFLGAGAKAADSDKLDGRDSLGFLKGFEAWLYTDMASYADGVTIRLGHGPEGQYPGMLLQGECNADGTTTLVAESSEPFAWWVDGDFGQTPFGTPPYSKEIVFGAGVERHSLRAVSRPSWYTTTLELDSALGDGMCTFGWTLFKTANASPN